jgi:hypothetical protein
MSSVVGSRRVYATLFVLFAGAGSSALLELPCREMVNTNQNGSESSSNTAPF